MDRWILNVDASRHSTCSPAGSGSRWSGRCPLLSPPPLSRPQRWQPASWAAYRRCDRGLSFGRSGPAGTEESDKTHAQTDSLFSVSISKALLSFTPLYMHILPGWFFLSRSHPRSALPGSRWWSPQSPPAARTQAGFAEKTPAQTGFSLEEPEGRRYSAARASCFCPCRYLEEQRSVSNLSFSQFVKFFFPPSTLR